MSDKVNSAIILKRIKAQIDLCRDRGYPHFAPGNGICWSCLKNIYTKKDGESHITACPHCFKTYND